MWSLPRREEEGELRSVQRGVGSYTKRGPFLMSQLQRLSKSSKASGGVAARCCSHSTAGALSSSL